MIASVDESLRELVRRDVLNGTDVEISFEAPSREWSARRNAPALNLYLYDIREDLQRRPVQFEERRDESGMVVSRSQPARKFKLAYLVTAWTQRPEDEHRLLSAVLSCFVRFDALPAEILAGGLADQPDAVRCTIALPPPPERSLSDVWSALGGELKPALDLVVTAPFVSSRYQEVGPPVTEEPFVRVGTAGGTLEAAARRRPGADDPAGQDDATEGPDGGAAGRETIERGKIKVGRRIEMVSYPRPSP